MSHPDDLELLDLAAGRATGEASAQARLHVDACRSCLRQVEALRRLGQAIGDRQVLGSSNSLPVETTTPIASRPHSLRLKEVAARSSEGLLLSEEILIAARSGAPELMSALSRLNAHPALLYGLLAACQRGGKLASQSPQAALRLALAVESETRRLSPDDEIALRSTVLAEACLLSSQALLSIGRTADSLQAISNARAHFDQAGAGPFQHALCDYFEGTSQGFAGDAARAERLLKGSLRMFATYGQDHWTGRAEINLGLVLGQRGDDRRAITFLDQGLARLDPHEDAHAVAAALINRGSCQAHLGEYDAAAMSYSAASSHTTQHDLAYYRHQVRTGLAELEFLKGDLVQALHAFGSVSAEARVHGYEENITFSALYLAECHARLGQEDAMAATIESLRAEWPRRRSRNPFQGADSPAIEELFACLDRGDLDAGLIRHVRLYLETDGDRAGIAYRSYRSA
ncbi:MAG: hypothetical protein ABIT01_15115 [Thermoanaerobaculia bacterium]